MASFDKYDTLVQANHDQLGSLEETFVLWKQRVELLTTAADQSLGSQKMEERRRERGDKKLMWECYVGHEARVSQLLQHLRLISDEVSPSNRLINSVIEPFTFSSTKRPSPAWMESSTICSSMRFRGPPGSVSMCGDLRATPW